MTLSAAATMSFRQYRVITLGNVSYYVRNRVEVRIDMKNPDQAVAAG